MAKVIIEGIDGIAGSYDLDLGRFSNAELRLIKREAGVRAGEVQEALEAEDNDMMVCFAIIAIERSGRYVHHDLIWNADAGKIRLDFSDEKEEADASPPEPQDGSPESEPAPITSS